MFALAGLALLRLELLAAVALASLAGLGARRHRHSAR